MDFLEQLNPEVPPPTAEERASAAAAAEAAKPTRRAEPLPAAEATLVESWRRRAEDKAEDSSSPAVLVVGPASPEALDAIFTFSWGDGHVERRERLVRCIRGVADGVGDRALALGGRLSDEETLEAIAIAHTPEFVRAFSRLQRGEALEEPTPLRSLASADGGCRWESVAPAIAAACASSLGGALALVDALVGPRRGGGGGARAALCVGRPAGHHSAPGSSGTFCGPNTVMIAARHARRRLAVARVAVVDVDIHYSGGHQAALAEAPDEGIALFDLWMALGPRDAPIFFPGARAAADLGAGAGDAGPVSRSLRLPDAVTHERFVDTWAAAVAPALASFRPALVVLSLGLDGAEGESEGARLAPETYAFVARQIAGLGVPQLAVLEGGYNLDVLQACVGAYAGALT